MDIQYNVHRNNLEMHFETTEDKVRFISILCLARQRVQSKLTHVMIDDLLKELQHHD